MGMEVFHELLNRDPGEVIHTQEDRLCGKRDVTPAIEGHEGEQVLLVRLDGKYYIESYENAAIAASADPDFVAAIPLSKLRPLILRSVN